MFRSHLSEAELVEYADGELSGSRLRVAQEHVRTCAACSEALETLQGVSDTLQTLLAPPTPATLRQEVAAKLTAEPLSELSCRRAAALIHQSLDAALPPLEAGLLRLHVDGCAACRQEQVSLTAVTGAVRRLPQLAAPAWIRQSVRASRTVRPLSWSVRLRPAFAAAAMAAGALIVTLSSRGPAPVLVGTSPVKHTVVAQARPAKPAPVQQPEAAVESQPTPPPVTIALQSQPVSRPAPRGRQSMGYRMAMVAEAPEPVVSRGVAAPRSRPGRPLAVHFVAREPAPAPTEEKPRALAFQAIRVMAKAASQPTAQSRLAALEAQAQLEKDEALRFPMPVAARSLDTGASSSTQPAGPSGDAGAASTHGKSSARATVTQSA